MKSGKKLLLYIFNIHFIIHFYYTFLFFIHFSIYYFFLRDHPFAAFAPLVIIILYNIMKKACIMFVPRLKKNK